MSNNHKYWHNRGYLPHFDAPKLIQHISFHLADSLPAQKVQRMLERIDVLPINEQKQAKIEYWQQLLDNGYGCCLLKQSNFAAIIQDSLLFGDQQRYRLLAWVIMPNHVHALIEQKENWPLSKIVQSWKRHSSRQIHKLDSSTINPLWQRDYWDRFVRNEQHYYTTKHYIEANPVKAGLVTSAEQWPWSSAAGRADLHGAPT